MKVGNQTCEVHADFKKAIKVCFAPYASKHEETGKFLPDFRKFSAESA